MVDRRWRVLSIIDWDDCARLEVGGEYARRVTFVDPADRMHQWDHFFLRIARDRAGELLMSGTHSQNPPPSSTQSSPLGRHKEYWVQLDQLGNKREVL
jgi:hypothetical protein